MKRERQRSKSQIRLDREAVLDWKRERTKLGTISELAKRLGLHKSTVAKILLEAKQDGTIPSRKTDMGISPGDSIFTSWPDLL